MSRLRNRNVRTKIQAVAKWGHHFAAATMANAQKTGKLFDHDATTTADSGIAEIAPKLNDLEPHRMRTRARRNNWNLDSALASDAERRKEKSADEESSDDESRNSRSSVDTLKVLDEIRNLEDSVKSMSAESYNSWNEEYENDGTRLVKAEFERMERVLQYREPIPAHYDKEEYKLWIKTFPLLSLVSRTSSLDFCKNTPRLESLDSSPKFCDNTPALSPSKNESGNNILNHLKTVENIDNFDPDNVLLYPSLTSNYSQMPTRSTTTYTNKYLAINNTINPRTLNVTGDHSFLQLAPLNVSAHPASRRQSFKPASNTHSTSGNKHRNSSNVYSSNRTADWLKDVHTFNDFRRVTRTLYGQQEYHLRTPENYEKQQRRKSSKTEPFKSTSEFIVLPPIEGKELRSSSAATICSLGNKATILPLRRLKHPPVGPLYENDKESDQSDGFVSYRHRKRRFK